MRSRAIDAGIVRGACRRHAARAPRLEQRAPRSAVIYLVGLTLRLSYHVYYGPGVIVFLLWAAVAIWLFRRTRRITPLIAAHVVI